MWSAKEVGPLHFVIDKGYDEDLGIEFGDDLFDRVHICKNKCVFCFLYQQPKGLRPSLYIKDDDYRLSFLHGNYLTLTNMGEDEFQRVIDQKLSPLFVSVHATDPEVRGRMLGRKGAGADPAAPANAGRRQNPNPRAGRSLPRLQRRRAAGTDRARTEPHCTRKRAAPTAASCPSPSSPSA